MFLRAAKTEAEDAGESTDGMAKSVSELRKELLSLTGNKVDIQIDEDTFKSTYQIIKELSVVWEELTDISQANILEMIGGKRNSNVVSALLENFSMAEDVLKTSAESAGSALAENEKYLDSIQGKISIFKASFEELSSNTINGEFVKFIVEAGTALVNFLNTMQELHLLLPGIAGSIITIKGLKLAKELADLSKTVSNLISKTVTEKAAADGLSNALGRLTRKQQERALAELNAALSSDKVSDEEREQILTTLGLTAAEGGLITANGALGASFKALAASIPAWGWVALVITVVISVVTLLAAAIKAPAEELQKLDEEFNNLVSTARATASEFQSLKSSADDTIPRFAELAKGVSDLGENISLTDEEYAEFWELNNKLAEMFPELDAGLDSNGNHILTLSYSINTLTESLRELVQAEREAANEKIAGNMGDALKNMKSADKASAKQKKALEEIREIHRNAQSEIGRMYDNQDTYKKAYGEAWQREYQGEIAAQITSAQQKLDALSDEAGTTWRDMFDKYWSDPDALSMDWRMIVNSDEFEGQISAIDRQLDDFEKKRTAQSQKMTPIMGAWLQTTDDYAIASEDVQTLLSKVVGNIDYSKLGITKEKELKKHLTDNFVKPITEAAPEVQNALVALFDIKSAFGAGALNVGEYGAIDHILGELQKAGINNEILLNIKTMLNVDEFDKQLAAVKAGINGADNDVQDFIANLTSDDFDLVYSIIAENGSMSLDQLIEKLKQARYDNAGMVEPLDFSGFADGLDEAAKGVDKIVSAMEKLAEGTRLSKKEVLDLIAQYPQLLHQADLFASGSVEAQKNALNAVLDMKEQEYDAQIDAKIAELRATQKVLDEQLTLEEKKANLINDIKSLEVNGKVEQEESLMDKINALNELQGKNFVSFKDGELQVNEEALNDQLEQGVEFGEKSATNIWDPLGESIVSAHKQGFSSALDTATDYAKKLWTRTKDLFGNMKDAVVALLKDFFTTGKAGDIDTYFKDVFAPKDGDNNVNGGPVVVNFGGSETTIGNQKVDDWVDEQEKASKERIAKIKKIQVDNMNAIRNLESLKGLKLTDIYASKSSGDKKKKTDDDEVNLFKQLYEYHNHLVSMNKETVSDYLKWLDNAYKAAYKKGEATLSEYYKFSEEVYKGLQDLFKEYLSDSEHEISMRENHKGESKKIIATYKKMIAAVEKEIKAARKKGLNDTDEYIQTLQSKWQSYNKSIKEIREEATANAKNTVKELVDVRIDMLKQDIDKEKDALKKKLDYLKEFYQKQKDMLQDAYDEEKYLEEQSEHRKAVTDLQVSLNQLEYDDSAWAKKRKLKLAEELAEAQKELNNFERDHALETAQDKLDSLYEMQEKKLNAQTELLESKQEDAKALYDRALADIKKGSVKLYEEMIVWNRTYGDGIDNTIKTSWENAYTALQDYYDLYGKYYENVKLSNTTGYTAPADSWDSSKVSGTSAANKTTTAAATTAKITAATTTAVKTATAQTTAAAKPSLTKGSSVKVKSGTKWYADSYGGGSSGSAKAGKIKYINTKGSHAYNIDGLGWVKKTDIVGYASGTKKATTGIHGVDERGMETIFESADGSRYKMFSGGEKVLNAKASDFLYEFANGGSEILEKILRSSLGGGLFDTIRPSVHNSEINMGDIVVNGSCDQRTVSEIRRAQRDGVSSMLKEFNKLNK